MTPPIPPLEDRCSQILMSAKLDAEDIQVLWLAFLRHDRAQSGVITQDQFHDLINDEELLFFFGMCIFDIVGARNYKAINFSDFVHAMITFSCFGKEELLRFAFNAFDPERNGTIDLSDYGVMSRLLHARSSIMHDIHALGSNVSTVISRMDSWVQDDLRIDFDEFVETNRLYPWILKPAEKLRRKIREISYGDDWWRDRVEQLHWERQARMELLKGAAMRKSRWEESRESRADTRKIRRRMGNPLFYLCPILRPCFVCKFWDPSRKQSKLRNDAIKQRIDNRYKTAKEPAAAAKPVKHIPPKPQPRVQEKQDAREIRKAERREKRSKGRTARATRGKQSR